MEYLAFVFAVYLPVRLAFVQRVLNAGIDLACVS